jgi:hypothetical protein
MKTYIQLVKTAAARIRQSKLRKLGTKETSEALTALTTALNFNDKNEAIIFAALFDASCNCQQSDIDDLARYFDSTVLDVIEYMPALNELMKRGLVVQTNANETRRNFRSYMVPSYVLDCITNNHMPESVDMKLFDKEFDRYDFCKIIDDQVEDREIQTESLMQMTQSLENEHTEFQFIQELKKLIPEIHHRVIFYSTCKDFYSSMRCRHRVDIEHTLNEIFGDAFSTFFREKRMLVEGTHPLIKQGLIEISSDKEDILLSEKGKKLFLEEDYATFCAQYANLDRYKFAEAVADFVHSREYDNEVPDAMARLDERILQIEDCNSSLGMLQRIRQVIKRSEDRALFYLVCDSCAKEHNDTNLMQELSELYPMRKRKEVIRMLKLETHELQVTGLAEIHTRTSLFGGENTFISLTDKGKELFFEEDAHLFIETTNGNNNCIAADKIVEKRLFYSDEQQRQLSLVEDSIQEENYQKLVSRLEAKGLPKGIAVLLYGAPGTGKTETVMQWAKRTGRDVMHVDISNSKSMWFGESEKIVKKIFSDYRSKCNSSKGLKPILLFNEADAIFSTRQKMTGHNSTVTQTENAIQNIILEEMERLDGILIATTNLQSNLDAAFERRFLFKIHFEKPSLTAKQNIWRDKLPSLDDEQAKRLATAFDFSGGEIDNIVRKVTMQEVVSGNLPGIDEIITLCSNEKLAGCGHGRVGF